MKEYQQKHVIRTLLYSRVTMVVLFLLIIFLLRSIIDLNNKRIDVSRLRQESLSERKDLEEKVAKAKEKEASIQTPRGFESYVRTTYPVVQDGEGVIVIYDAGQSPVTPVREDMTVWERLLVFWNKVIKHQ
jgi:hypothetical protein